MPSVEFEEVANRIARALKYIQAETIGVSEMEGSQAGKRLIGLVVIATNFEHMRATTRNRVINDTLLQRDPELCSKVMFAYECFTPQEYRIIRLCKNELH